MLLNSLNILIFICLYHTSCMTIAVRGRLFCNFRSQKLYKITKPGQLFCNFRSWKLYKITKPDQLFCIKYSNITMIKLFGKDFWSRLFCYFRTQRSFRITRRLQNKPTRNNLPWKQRLKNFRIKPMISSKKLRQSSWFRVKIWNKTYNQNWII